MNRSEFKVVFNIRKTEITYTNKERESENENAIIGSAMKQNPDMSFVVQDSGSLK